MLQPFQDGRGAEARIGPGLRREESFFFGWAAMKWDHCNGKKFLNTSGKKKEAQKDSIKLHLSFIVVFYSTIPF